MAERWIPSRQASPALPERRFRTVLLSQNIALNSHPTRKPNYWLALFRFLRSKKSEEVGFEPTNPSQGFLFSRQAHSATLPLFRIKRENIDRSVLQSNMISGKLSQKSQVVLPELTDVANVVLQNRRTLEPHPPSKTTVLLGINVSMLQDIRMHHSRSTHF